MRRPKGATVATFVVYLVMVAAVVFLFIVQQGRINTDEANYSHLFTQYTKSVSDCSKAADCTSTVPAPSVIKGAAGIPGQNGVNGVNGENATDQQVFSAVTNYCALRGDCDGPNGQAGQTGLPGMNGTNGADGAPGAPGPAGADGTAGQPPSSWTYTDSLGFPHTCTRTDPFDPASPTYSCN